jgi:predicted nucleotidyltransferase
MLSDQDKQVLTELKAVFDALNIPMLLVGAGARLIIFDNRYKIQGRSTKDWDIAIPIGNWSDYRVLRDRLTQGDSPRFKTTDNAHQFIHLETRIAVDIVPFGKIGEPDQQIEWPDSGNPMNVAGFDEALQHASIETIDGLELQVVDTPALVALKLIAWGDRGERTRKDLDDIDFILKNYSDDERVYEELIDELVNGDIEYIDAPIYLVGQDIRKIFRDETVNQLNSLLEQLVPNSEDEVDDSPEYRLKVLQRGINRVISG